MDRRLIAANWKMNGSIGFARELIDGLSRELSGPDADLDNAAEVVIMPPSVLVPAVRDAVVQSGAGFAIGVQNIARWASGAYTGEVSAAMAADQACRYAIVGHSERRELFAETDEVVGEKVLQALAAGLKPILCVGETLTEREAGQALTQVGNQLRKGLSAVQGSQWSQVVIAYEPVWAIGTGVSASAEDAQAVHAHIRATLSEMGAPEQDIPVIYGGSVKPETAEQLFAQPDIDGGLIGGASLDASAFAAICRAC